MVTVQRAVKRGNVCKNGQVGNPPAMGIRLGWPFPSNPGLFSNNLQIWAFPKSGDSLRVGEEQTVNFSEGTRVLSGLDSR